MLITIDSENNLRRKYNQNIPRSSQCIKTYSYIIFIDNFFLYLQSFTTGLSNFKQLTGHIVP
jgi:hypothetical protein